MADMPRRPLPNRDKPPPPITPAEVAEYTAGMLASLGKLTAGSGQERLYHLLQLAREEANHLARELREA